MTTSTPPAWRWLDECEVPVGVYQYMTSETTAEESLSVDLRNLPAADTFRGQDDSPDPTYQGCRPSERYPSDGPDYWDVINGHEDRQTDQCSECRCAPGQPHAPGCDVSGSPDVSCDRKDDATWRMDGCEEKAVPSHRIGTRSLDPLTGEYVMQGDFFDGSTELRWSGSRHDGEPVATAESCPECGAVTDIEYGALMAEGYREMAEPEPASSAIGAGPVFGSEPELLTSTANHPRDVVTVRDGNPLHAHMRATFDACLAISVAKNADYAGDEDPLANFRECEKDGVPLIKGILVRIGDKRARMRRLLNGHEAQVADEKLTDTIRDKINYLAIVLYALETE